MYKYADIIRPLNREIITELVANERKLNLESIENSIVDIENLDFKYIKTLIERYLSRELDFEIKFNDTEIDMLEVAYWTLEGRDYTSDDYIQSIKRMNITPRAEQKPITAKMQIADTVTHEKGRIEKYSRQLQNMIDIKQEKINIKGQVYDTESIVANIQPFLMKNYYRTRERISDDKLKLLLESDEKILQIVDAICINKLELVRLSETASKLNPSIIDKDLINIARTGLIIGYKGNPCRSILVKYNNDILDLSLSDLERLLSLGVFRIGNPDVPSRQTLITYDPYGVDTPLQLVMTDMLKEYEIK
ncbi:hypothetical protein [Clostridium tertium]|uniref:hypothetical protein n=1 Tax=Clostridium tertium TaxID=1559 RepID=UPI0023B24D8F|nr:hypothetical protein [Clostridium tertium]